MNERQISMIEELKALARKHVVTAKRLTKEGNSLLIAVVDPRYDNSGKANRSIYISSLLLHFYHLVLEDYEPLPDTHAILIQYPRYPEDLEAEYSFTQSGNPVHISHGIVIKKSSAHYPTLVAMILESALG